MLEETKEDLSRELPAGANRTRQGRATVGPHHASWLLNVVSGDVQLAHSCYTQKRAQRCSVRPPSIDANAMWIAHYAPGKYSSLRPDHPHPSRDTGLIAKIFAPRVPLWLLAFAGEANDALFFLLQFTPLESFAVDPGLAQTGCFPYATHYPYSHSVLGMVLTGIALAGAYTALTGRKVSLGDQAAIVLTTLTHALLEWPAHRADVKVLPHDGTAIGAGASLIPAPSHAPLSVRRRGSIRALYATFQACLTTPRCCSRPSSLSSSVAYGRTRRSRPSARVQATSGIRTG